MATLDQLQLQLSALRAEFNRQVRPAIQALLNEANNGATRDQIYSRYQSLYASVISASKELSRIKSDADSIRSEFGVPDFIATVDDVASRIPLQQTDLDTALSTATRNTNTDTSTSQSASGGTASTPQTLGAASAANPDNANTAAGGQPSPGIPLGGAGATVTAIPGTAGRIAAGASGAIALPSNFGTTAGFPQTALSREDAGPTVAQNIRSSAQTAQPLEGGPLPNPLDKYASYTYNLSLYLCTPTEYNRIARTEAGPTISLPGDQLIARSGGAPIGANQRNEYFSDVDMVIDNLKIENTIGFSSTGVPTSGGKLSFTITEPAGATFLYRLQSAVAALYNKDPTVGKTFYGNSTFALVIRFYGYDSNGVPIAARGVNQIDAAGSTESALLTKTFFFVTDGIKTRIGTRIVEYHIGGVFAPMYVAKSAILGVSPARFELTGTNLNDIFNGIPGSSNTATPDENPRAETNRDADAQEGGFYGTADKVSAQPSQNIPTRGLAQALNDEFNRLSRPDKQRNKVIEIPDEYEIIFASEALKNAKVVIPGADNDLSRAAGVKPADTKAINTKKNTSIDKNSKIFNIMPGTPIIQWLDQMIRNSDYIKKQASAIISENTDADIQGEENFYGEKTNQPKSPVKWYKITPYIQIKQYDNLRKTYAYKITYVISDYYIVDAKSPYFKRAPWPGPDKLYLYTFTGQNTAILNYEQDFNWLYRQTFSVNAPLGQDAAKQAARQAGMVDNSYAFRVVAETGKQGSLGDSTDLSARAAAGIYSPTDLATVKIKIVGDPDYLLQDWYNVNQALLTRAEYKRSVAASSSGLNSNFGELYMQITFLTGDDWNLASGVVKVEPRSGYVRRVSNAYRINTIVSTFQNGRFEQDVQGTLLTGVDPERAIVKGDYVAGSSVGSETVNTDTTDTDSGTARQETTDTATQETGAFDTDGSNDLRTQEGGSSTVPQSSTGALPAPAPPFSSPLASRLQELGVQRDQFRRGLLPNQAQVGNDDAPPDIPYG